MPIGDNRNVVTDTNSSVLDPLYQVQSPAQPRPQDILSGIGQGLGIQEAISTMTGGTPEEQQMFALGAAPMLIAPEVKAFNALEKAVPFAAQLPKYAEEMFSEAGATIHKLQKPGRWPTFVATSPTGESYQFKDFNAAKKWVAPPEVMRPDPPASPMESPPWEEPIRAYHGSPYDFERFDISQVGTGQGAQSYGHGLYFAEEPAVAKDYQEQLSGRRGVNPNAFTAKTRWLVNGEPAPEGISGHAALDTAGDIDRYLYFVKSNTDPGVRDVLKQRLDQRVAKFREEDKKGWATGSAGEDMRALADYYDKYVRNVSPGNINERPPGRMYEVNINANPEHFVDWDKPIGEQQQKVKDALYEVVKKDAYGRALSATDKKRADELWGMVKDPNKAPAGFAQEILKKPEFVEQLRKAGVPGIRYLDQGSRKGTVGGEVRQMKWGEGGTNFRDRFGVYQGDKLVAAFDTRKEAESATKGTYNYVVFDDKLIDITKKIGLAGLIAGGASNWSPDQAQAGEVIKLGGKNPYGIPGMTGSNVEEMAAKNKQNQTRATLMRALGGGADVLPITPKE